jgi:hypothetical protein
MISKTLSGLSRGALRMFSRSLMIRKCVFAAHGVATVAYPINSQIGDIGKLFTNHLNPLKTTFPKRPETNSCQPLSSKQRGKQCPSSFESWSSRRALMPVRLLRAFNSRTCPMSLIKWRRNIDVKKPTLQIQEQQPRNIQRADIAAANGFALVVDGHFKTEFGSGTLRRKLRKNCLHNFRSCKF